MTSSMKDLLWLNDQKQRMKAPGYRNEVSLYARSLYSRLVASMVYAEASTE